MHKDAIRFLLEQYLNGQLTEAQGEELLAKTNNDVEEREVVAVLNELIEEESVTAVPLDAEMLRASLQKVLAVDKGLHSDVPVRRLVSRRGWWAAAAILIVLGMGSYFAIFNKRTGTATTTPTQAGRFKNDVAPGTNKATLTLSNGQQLLLDSATRGVLAEQGNAQVQQSVNGRLSYNILAEKPSAVLYNTLTTPRGGVYQLVLPDGSRVWLNAASSIRYPVFFSGPERKVEITGEAYLEVAKNARQPFIVEVDNDNRATIQVLGTAFNVNAYPDEKALHTTLLEGAVRVSKDKKNVVLRPGEQAELEDSTAAGTGGRMDVHVGVDTSSVVAWKNGQFRFRGEGLDVVLRQIARWYDVEVEVRGALSGYPLVGNIPRDEPVSEVLKLLELTGVVHFAIDGKKIIVLPK